MKKCFLVIMAAFVLILAACAPPIVASGGIVHRGAAPVCTVDINDIDQFSDEEIVYVTKSGEKYHTADCAHLSESCIPVTLDQALAEGKEPCSQCH